MLLELLEPEVYKYYLRWRLKSFHTTYFGVSSLQKHYLLWGLEMLPMVSIVVPFGGYLLESLI